MSEKWELKIDSTLWATPTKLVKLLDFIPNKLSVQTQSNAKSSINIHYIEYDNGGFYLIIDNLKGYFDFSNNTGYLNMLFVNNDQQMRNNQVWKEILKLIINGVNEKSELKSDTEIRLFSIDDLPIGYVFKIHSMTIVVRSIVEKDSKFYPQISLNHCSYEV